MLILPNQRPLKPSLSYHLGDGPFAGAGLQEAPQDDASPFTPLDLSPDGWWSTRLSNLFQDTGRTTPITADGQTLKDIDDLSGHGRHMADSTGCTYKTNIIGGQAVARFSDNQVLATDGTPFNYDRNDPWTVCVVMKNNGGDASFFEHFDSTANYIGWRVYCLAGTPSVQIIKVFGSTFIQVHGSTTITDSVARLLTFRYDGSRTAAGVSIRVNGVEEIPSVASDTLPDSSIQNSVTAKIAGVQNFLTGDQPETIVIPTYVSGADLTNLEGYLMEAFGL